MAEKWRCQWYRATNFSAWWFWLIVVPVCVRQHLSRLAFNWSNDTASSDVELYKCNQQWWLMCSTFRCVLISTTNCIDDLAVFLLFGSSITICQKTERFGAKTVSTHHFESCKMPHLNEMFLVDCQFSTEIMNRFKFKNVHWHLANMTEHLMYYALTWTGGPDAGWRWNYLVRSFVHFEIEKIL